MDLTFPWLEFHGIDVAEVFYLLIDVAVAVLATRTSISGNPATPTSIRRKSRPNHIGAERQDATQANAKSENVHASVTPTRI